MHMSAANGKSEPELGVDDFDFSCIKRGKLLSFFIIIPGKDAL